MIGTLIWKDIRLNAPVFLAGVLLIVAPYLCVLAWMYSMAAGTFPWAKAILAGSYCSQWLSLLTCALLGGNAIACEREDGSDRFLAALPVKRDDVLFSKLVVALIAFECLWTVNPCLLRATAHVAGVSFRDTLPGAVSMPAIASTALMVFGVSWFWSTVLTRPVGAALAGIACCGLVYVTAQAIHTAMASESQGFLEGTRVFAPGIIGLLGVAAGALQYHRAGESRRAGPGRLSGLFRSETEAPLRMPNRRRAGTRRLQMAAMVWKDLRLLRPVLLLGAALVVMPYAIAAIDARASEDAIKAYARASGQSLWLCCLVLPVWAGYIIAAERTTESERFLAYMPVSRLTIVSSKLCVSLFPSCIVLAANLALVLILHHKLYWVPAGLATDTGFLRITWSSLVWQPTSLMFSLPVLGAPMVAYGVAWLASARLTRPLQTS